MRHTTTALIALFSVLSVPLASAVCTDCCYRSAEHQLTLCHARAHAHQGPHVHHMGHMNHVHMVIGDSEVGVEILQRDHQLHGSRLSCDSVACLGARPVQACAASVPSHQPEIPPPLLATRIYSSLPSAAPGRPPDIRRMAINHALSPSVPLRI